MSHKEMLDRVKIFVSPITKKSYLCLVNSKNIITEKRELTEDDMMEFVFGIAETLETKYGCDIKLEDSKKQINLGILYREKKNEE